MSNFVLWDFDGTLGCRIDGLHGRAWSMSMLEAVQQKYAGTDMTIDDIAPYLGQGFPWHEPEKAHTHLHTPELWWAHICRIFTDIYMRLGFSKSDSEQLAGLARARFVDLKNWSLYEDTLPVVKRFHREGWGQLIVSNHVPELAVIVRHLGLEPYMADVINSAVVGYEKPHPEIFKIALDRTGHARNVWMIGDNIHADVFGAQQAGIPSILVRSKDERAKHQFDDLAGLAEFLLSG